MVGDDDILYLSVIRNLLENKVEFILLGGMAVNYHGVKRFTNDMDLWINPTKENFDKVLRALVDLGYEEEEINNIKRYDRTWKDISDANELIKIKEKLNKEKGKK